MFANFLKSRLSVPAALAKKTKSSEQTSDTAKGQAPDSIQIIPQDITQFHTPEPSFIGGGVISVNDLDSFVTPNESMPDKCDHCHARHMSDDPHVIQV